jgi:Protein of unknown function (DUF499)
VKQSPAIFELCEPRHDVLAGSISESDFAADLAQVLRGQGPEEYLEPAKFFANTHPTRGLRDLLRAVCLRLSGSSQQVASIFRLGSSFGGGKTHGLIALGHIANGAQGVANIGEFIEPSLVPSGGIRVAAFDGENADPFNGRLMAPGVLARTPWGEIAYQLAGSAGFERLRRSDEALGAPGSETLRELFGGEPTLILLDELALYLRKLHQMGSQQAGGQLTAFMTALFKAIEGTPNAAVVYTLAIGKDNRATDAYSQENQFIADQMAEAESVSARKAALLDPTGEDETVKVLRRRLFESIDDAAAEAVVNAYRRVWEDNRDSLPKHDSIGERVEALREGYPLHPELLATFTNKTATLSNFQRVRGMLRLLARTVGQLWEDRPRDALAVHLHHVDPGFEPIRQEITTRLGQAQLLPAIRVDVAAVPGEPASLAQQMDRTAYTGLPTYGSYVGRTILWHTLAFNDALRGVSHEELRYAVLWPGADLGFVDDARKRFIQESAYLDDRPNVPLRFLAEANLTQIIRRQEQQVDTVEVRKQLNDRIKNIFKSGWFDPEPFPGGPYDVDDRGDGKPVLAVIGYDAAEIAADRVEIPELVARIYERTGSTNDLRLNRNNLVFLVVDGARKDEMRQKMIRRLALDDLRRPERLNELAEHQREQIRRLFGEAERDVATAIQQAYRHVLYPSKARLEGATVDLEHAAIELPSASSEPGKGQQQVVRALRDNHKLRLPDDDPDSPTYIRDRTPLKKGQISTAQLRAEFRRDPALPILAADEVFVRGLRQGVETGVYVYQSGDLIWARGLPPATIRIDEQSYVMTATYAREHQIWPKPEPKPVPSAGGAEPGAPGSDQLDLPPGDHRPGTRGRTITPAPPPQAPDLAAEGVLKEALTRIWEQARQRGFVRLTRLELRLFEFGDGFRLLAAVRGISGATKTTGFEGAYETAAGAHCEISFTGPIDDALPVKDFLDPQLRAAKDKDLSVRFAIEFQDGLELAGDVPETLTERLSRLGAGAAYVSATAEGSP